MKEKNVKREGKSRSQNSSLKNTKSSPFITSSRGTSKNGKYAKMVKEYQFLWEKFVEEEERFVEGA